MPILSHLYGNNSFGASKSERSWVDDFHPSRTSPSPPELYYLCTVICKSNANDYRRLSRFTLPIYRQYIGDLLFIFWQFKNDKSTRFGAFLRYLAPTINRSNDRSFRWYIAKTRYRRACGTSSRYIASVKYRSINLSLNQEWLIAIYRCSDISPQRVFLWREIKCLFTISRSSEIIKSYFRFLPPLCFGICKLLMLL